MPLVDPAPGNGARASGPTGDYPRPTTGDYPRLPSASDYALPPRPGGEGQGQGLRLEPPSGAPRRRLPELVLGVFLVAGCALAAVLLAAAGRERTPALALSRDVQRGEVITDADLSTIYVGSDSDLAYVDPDDISQIVDRAALANLPAGTLVTAEQFADPASVLSAGDATIGLALDAGQLPSLSLAPGDLVTVVAGGSGSGTQGQPDVVADAATVESVTEIQDQTGQQARWRVSLRLSENDATELAMALTSNAQVQLVMVER